MARRFLVLCIGLLGFAAAACGGGTASPAPASAAPSAAGSGAFVALTITAIELMERIRRKNQRVAASTTDAFNPPLQIGASGLPGQSSKDEPELSGNLTCRFQAAGVERTLFLSNSSLIHSNSS